jgi:metallo-beta-lactamase family protein
MALNAAPGPCIILSASGMMEAGRVLHHLRNSIEDPRNAVLIVGFQAEHTLGRRILRGDQEVNIFGEPHSVRAEVFAMNEYSAHADRAELQAWLRGLKGAPQDVFIVHGEEEQALAFAQHLAPQTGARVHVPRLHETYGLGGLHPHGQTRLAFDPAGAGDPAPEPGRPSPGRRSGVREENARRGRRTRHHRHR